MLKQMTAMLAVAALVTQPALAAPFSGSLTASETGEKAEKSKGSSLFTALVSGLKFSFASIGSSINTTPNDKADATTHNSTCEEADALHDDAAHSDEAKEHDAVGPEPLYFGF